MNDHRKDELMHYGVLGMKWGRRKSKSSSSSPRTGSKTKPPSEFKKRKIQNKETRADYRSDKGPKRFNMYNAANSAARTYYRSMRTNNLQTHLKQQAKLDLKVARLTDTQVKNGRYRVARARNIKRKTLSGIAGTAAGIATVSAGAGVIGVPVGLAVATAGNFASGAHYYARQQSAYGNARARYENKVKR